MPRNMGGVDRILRVIVGAILIVLAVLGVVGVWGYIGIVPVLTGLVGFCPAYLPLGIKTCGCQD